MGISHCSHANLGNNCFIMGGNESYAEALLGESFSLIVTKHNEENDADHAEEVWIAQYNHRCCIILKAKREYSGILKSICLQLADTGERGGTFFNLELIKTDHGLWGGVQGGNINTTNGESVAINIKTKNIKKKNVAESTTVSYGSPARRGLFVLEKNNANADDAYMVTLAHYYLTQDRGLSVIAKIDDTGDIEVEGPINHPIADLCKVFDKTCRTGEWSPTACPHCSKAKESTKTRNTVSSSFPRDEGVVVIGPFYYNYDNGNNTYNGSKINHSSNSGNRYHHRHNYGNHSSNSINNSGTFYGHGNGGFTRGNFDASTRNYY